MQVTARTHDGVDKAQAGDAPPEAFVERLPHEGGDVFVVPLLEALRDWLRKAKNVSRMSENNEYDTDESEEP